MSKIIVITGASSGIGEATAKLLAKEGHKLVVVARREERLQQLVKDIKDDGGEAIYVKADVASLDDNLNIRKQSLETFGRIDVWINNAGIMTNSEMAKGLVKEWDTMIDVNFKGVAYGIHAALEPMRAQKSGQIINVSSVAGHIAAPTTGIYAGTKFAVRAMSEALRQEEAAAGSNIRVTVISPGAIATELTLHASDLDSRQSMDAFYKAVAIDPIEIAKAIAFAVDADSNVAMNEIIIRPTAQVI